MKKAFSILLLSVLLSPIMAFAGEDQSCLDTCHERKYAEQYCQEHCADDASPMTRQQTIRQVDPNCMNDCTGSGHDNTYCTRACSY